MCLNVEAELTEKLKQGPWPRKVYKALKWSGAAFQSNVQAFVWSPGVNKSDRTSTEVSAQNGDDIISGEIYHGFHVCLNKADAEDSDGELVVEFDAFPEHLVAGGSNNGICPGAVFTELTLSQEEYNRAVKATDLLEEDDDWDEDEDDDYYDDWEDDDDWEDEEEEDDDWDDDEEEDEDEWGSFEDWE